NDNNRILINESDPKIQELKMAISKYPKKEINLNQLRQDLENMSLDLVDLSEEQAAKVQAQVQVLEDRAIEVAVGFESLQQRLKKSPSSSRTTSRASSRPSSGVWPTSRSSIGPGDNSLSKLYHQQQQKQQQRSPTPTLSNMI